MCPVSLKRLSVSDYLEHTYRSEATGPVSDALNLYTHKEMYALKIYLY